LPDYAGIAAKSTGHKAMTSTASAREPSTATYDATTMFWRPKPMDASAVPEKDAPKVSTERAVGTPGRIYTTNPHEVGTQTTQVTFKDVVPMLKEKWPELTNEGAKTLAAQFAGETGNGVACFNYNLGNVKAGPNEPHMYLKDVPELATQKQAEAIVAKSTNGLVRIATPEEVKSKFHMPAAKEGMAYVVFSAPDPGARFRAYSSLGDGAARWLAHHQAIAKKDPEYLAALNRGDVNAAAHALRKSGYYTADEHAYASLMTSWKKRIDKEMP
jgi:hypothetical protein